MPETPATPGENTQKRQSLLDSALKLFAERGFDGVGMREIAAEAGVSLGLIRVHFGSKHGLRDELDNYVLQGVRRLYEGVAEHGGSEGLKYSVDDTLAFIESDRYVLMYLRTALLQKNTGSLAMLVEIHGIIRRFIDNCEQQGNLQAGVDKDQATLMMLFDLLGPVIIEPFAQEMFGASMYQSDRVLARNSMARRMFTQGFLRK
ncbi:MAG: TetR/AcrR family transcriptional regulator [Cellvibrionaceae bacterium]|nr:TetR/AcrR family transcriptional regulator [Cellvibrionaceae bacterium]